MMPLKRNFHAEAPQRLHRIAEICDRCGAVDSFKARARVNGITYCVCTKCGRRATRQTHMPSREDVS